ncbi:uncharacterized protein CMU_026560 [Cryptosporidium muris RN66]|uniref:Uncharacterized protein n=1 Tax=Cryptosporidium muris (strain RN66) TaxID=441375 RepID=B6AB96_CRYMR|nr:uncharacterized protein CMU_026560 [Cryptosporidium muris RN66]EEA05648.1 hypothetical protein, conserved [Cryptosporidium muris RN66]|eukprot:XP_002139997.1 hypothetical protein [Cryptosporidium muris RN66]
MINEKFTQIGENVLGSVIDQIVDNSSVHLSHLNEFQSSAIMRLLRRVAGSKFLNKQPIIESEPVRFVFDDTTDPVPSALGSSSLGILTVIVNRAIVSPMGFSKNLRNFVNNPNAEWVLEITTEGQMVSSIPISSSKFTLDIPASPISPVHYNNEERGSTKVGSSSSNTSTGIREIVFNFVKSFEITDFNSDICFEIICRIPIEAKPLEITSKIPCRLENCNHLHNNPTDKTDVNVHNSKISSDIDSDHLNLTCGDCIKSEDYTCNSKSLANTPIRDFEVEPLSECTGKGNINMNFSTIGGPYKQYKLTRLQREKPLCLYNNEHTKVHVGKCNEGNSNTETEKLGFEQAWQVDYECVHFGKVLIPLINAVWETIEELPFCLVDGISNFSYNSKFNEKETDIPERLNTIGEWTLLYSLDNSINNKPDNNRNTNSDIEIFPSVNVQDYGLRNRKLTESSGSKLNLNIKKDEKNDTNTYQGVQDNVKSLSVESHSGLQETKKLYSDPEIEFRWYHLYPHVTKIPKYVRPVAGILDYGLSNPIKTLGFIQIGLYFKPKANYKYQIYFKSFLNITQNRASTRWLLPEAFEPQYFQKYAELVKYTFEHLPRWIPKMCYLINHRIPRNRADRLLIAIFWYFIASIFIKVSDIPTFTWTILGITFVISMTYRFGTHISSPTHLELLSRVNINSLWQGKEGLQDQNIAKALRVLLKPKLEKGVPMVSQQSGSSTSNPVNLVNLTSNDPNTVEPSSILLNSESTEIDHGISSKVSNSSYSSNILVTPGSHIEAIDSNNLGKLSVKDTSVKLNGKVLNSNITSSIYTRSVEGLTSLCFGELSGKNSPATLSNKVDLDYTAANFPSNSNSYSTFNLPLNLYLGTEIFQRSYYPMYSIKSGQGFICDKVQLELSDSPLSSNLHEPNSFSESSLNDKFGIVETPFGALKIGIRSHCNENFVSIFFDDDTVDPIQVQLNNIFMVAETVQYSFAWVCNVAEKLKNAFNFEDPFIPVYTFIILTSIVGIFNIGYLVITNLPFCSLFRSLLFINFLFNMLEMDPWNFVQLEIYRNRNQIIKPGSMDYFSRLFISKVKEYFRINKNYNIDTNLLFIIYNLCLNDYYPDRFITTQARGIQKPIKILPISWDEYLFFYSIKYILLIVIFLGLIIRTILDILLSDINRKIRNCLYLWWSRIPDIRELEHRCIASSQFIGNLDRLVDNNKSADNSYSYFLGIRQTDQFNFGYSKADNFLRQYYFGRTASVIKGTAPYTNEEISNPTNLSESNSLNSNLQSNPISTSKGLISYLLPNTTDKNQNFNPTIDKQEQDKGGMNKKSSIPSSYEILEALIDGFYSGSKSSAKLDNKEISLDNSQQDYQNESTKDMKSLKINNQLISTEEIKSSETEESLISQDSSLKKNSFMEDSSNIETQVQSNIDYIIHEDINHTNCDNSNCKYEHMAETKQNSLSSGVQISNQSTDHPENKNTISRFFNSFKTLSQNAWPEKVFTGVFSTSMNNDNNNNNRLSTFSNVYSDNTQNISILDDSRKFIRFQNPPNNS